MRYQAALRPDILCFLDFKPLSQFPIPSGLPKSTQNTARFSAFYLDGIDSAINDKVDFALDAQNIQKALQLCKDDDQDRFERGVLAFVPYLMRVGSYNTALEYLRDAETHEVLS